MGLGIKSETYIIISNVISSSSLKIYKIISNFPYLLVDNVFQMWTFREKMIFETFDSSLKWNIKNSIISWSNKLINDNNKIYFSEI